MRRTDSENSQSSNQSNKSSLKQKWSSMSAAAQERVKKMYATVKNGKSQDRQRLLEGDDDDGDVSTFEPSAPALSPSATSTGVKRDHDQTLVLSEHVPVQNDYVTFPTSAVNSKSTPRNGQSQQPPMQQQSVQRQSKSSY
jgi:hypothetical protein